MAAFRELVPKRLGLSLFHMGVAEAPAGLHVGHESGLETYAQFSDALRILVKLLAEVPAIGATDG